MKTLFSTVFGFIKTHVAISVATAVVVTAAAGVGIGFAVHNARRDESADPPVNKDDLVDIEEVTSTEHVHSYVLETIEATCGHGGYTLHSCECGDAYRTDEVEPLAHEYGEWVVSIPATVTNEGQQEKHCLHCNDRIIEAIPQLEEHVHTYEDKVFQPSCYEKGFTQHTCTSCGYKFIDTETAATGHSWSSWTVTKEASTTEAGEKVRSCLSCGKPESESVPMVVQLHTHSYSETVVEPTCTEEGYTVFVCSCGDRYTANETPKRGHLYGNWETIKQPTTTETGEKQCACSRCNHVLTESIDKLDEATANLYENYIDPRIEVEQTGDGYTRYLYDHVGAFDTRSWGTPPSISISANGSLYIIYYNLSGEKVEVSLSPVAGYVNRCVIFDDGTYQTRLIGDYND